MVSGRSLVTYAIIRRACLRARDLTHVITDKHTLFAALFHCLYALLYFFINPLEMKCARHMTFCAFASEGVRARARVCACVRTCTRVVEVMLGPGGGVVFSHEYSWGPPS